MSATLLERVRTVIPGKFIIRRDARVEKSRGGIYLPDRVRVAMMYGEVIRMGARPHEAEYIAKFDVGDRVCLETSSEIVPLNEWDADWTVMGCSQASVFMVVTGVKTFSDVVPAPTRVLIEMDPDITHEGSLELPDSKKKVSQWGAIRAAGKNCKHKVGKRVWLSGGGVGYWLRDDVEGIPIENRLCVCYEESIGCVIEDA